MKFGYLTPEELDRISIHLPHEPAANNAVLAGGKRTQQPAQIFAGCAEYRVPEWKGLLYPAHAKDGELLERYAAQYNMMEMNGTHYKIYPPEQIAKWAQAAGDRNFRFLPKFPQLISHDGGSFRQLETLTAAFLESVAHFGQHLGPLFLQMSEYYSPAGRSDLFRYLATLPEGFTYFLELRHPAWFTDAVVSDELFAALRDLGIGAVITDTPGRREVCHMHLTIPKAFIRFVGSQKHAGTQQRIDEWMRCLRRWTDAGLQELYFAVHTGLSAPVTSVYVINELNKIGDNKLQIPHLIEQTGTLF